VVILIVNVEETSEKIASELKIWGVEYSEIGLHRSRATTEAKPTSDWDFYVLLPKEQFDKLTPDERRGIAISVSEKVSPTHPFGVDCTFGPDFSKCVQVTLWDKRPLTGKPILFSEKFKSVEGEGRLMGDSSCEKATKAAVELLEEMGCGIDAFAGLSGLYDGNALSGKCEAILGHGISRETCIDLKELARWVVCRAGEIHESQKLPFRDSMSRAWDEAAQKCKELID